MIPFVIVKTAKGSAFIRPKRVVAINATDVDECIILMTHGVTIMTKEAAEDVVAPAGGRIEEEDAASARGA